MNAPCSRCKKTVYPVEKFSCLDKIWHKGCFTCETCNLKLTMKTYKGYNKLPYCNTHYPTTKFTAVADTPENLRLSQQTKNQSDLVYHKDHKSDLSKFSKVTDTPASETFKKNQMNISDVHYQNKVGQRDQMEAARLAGQSGQQSDEGFDYNPAQELETGGYAQPPPSQPQVQAPPPQAYNTPPPQAYNPPPAAAQPPPQPKSSGPKYVAVYDYAAADEDEVSFREGDVIIDATVIDDGWMEGRVESTGAHGMLPSNYVEPM
ncbi:LIM and SH3 domain protein 1-like isoform X2 [Asterias rubens]|uniref:LIM and SH3 domain protein 1-like isoform X2 n=1 Tax=Asterias rubens TaxID=7604 RepID=UPI0014558446|nr:LIM and SH3 domain protein 1-like isoform X2 [Asterias rubens]